MTQLSLFTLGCVELSWQEQSPRSFICVINAFIAYRLNIQKFGDIYYTQLYFDTCFIVMERK